MRQTSKGFKWFSAFNLRLRALGIDPNEIGKLVLLIDEPGQGLSEKAQRDVKDVLEQLAGKGAQIIYTTHCPNLIGIEGRELSRIRLISNKKEGGTTVNTLTQFASRRDTSAMDTLSPIITAMGIHSVGALLDIKRKNVVVEEISAHYYLSGFRKIFGFSEDYYFLPACGVSNVPNLVSILIGWGLRYRAVFDDDKNSGRKAYNDLKKEFFGGNDDEAHKYIHKLGECNGIEDVFSKSDFRKIIATDEIKSECEANPEKLNSVIAGARKVLLSQLFFENAKDFLTIDFDDQTQAKVKSIFNWLDTAFGDVE